MSETYDECRDRDAHALAAAVSIPPARIGRPDSRADLPCYCRPRTTGTHEQACPRWVSP